jgi:hypothetical protein
MSVVGVPIIQAFGYIALLTYLPVALRAAYGVDTCKTRSAAASRRWVVRFSGIVVQY